MKKLRRTFDRFCLRNRDKGIPNLMLYLCIGSAIIYILTMVTKNSLLYGLLCFDKGMILRGQVWRLFTYAITYGLGNNNVIFVAIGLLCYYSLGRAMEAYWGTLRFNLFYLCGIVLTDIYCMIYGCRADVYYLNLSLLLSFSTLYPDTSFLLFFVIPVKAWVLALFNIGLILFGAFTNSFPYSLFPIISLLNYFLFFGADVFHLLPPSWRFWEKGRVSRRKAKASTSGPIIFMSPASQASSAQSAPAYTHRCTICGRTDVSNPELEFRYCSRCNGYHCYCIDHINNHTHIQ